MIKNKILTIVLLSALVGCGAMNKKKLAISDSQLYERGVNEVKSGDYRSAAKTLTQLENEYPASTRYADTLILKAYSLYSEEQYTDAILTIEDFLHQFPMHKDAAYMYYLKAMSNYNQIMDTGREQDLTIKAGEDFSLLIALYPHSKYAKDAKWKLEYIHNVMAGKEMDIGRFYLRTNQPIASINRFKNVIDNYQTSIFAPECLYRLTEVYFTLGVKKEATKYASVLGHNYPKSMWYKKAHDLLVNHGAKRK
ncbi:outer membrane protein assembly factor BamD [Candidatus Bandiella euplotis]|uniref:Outer membrane protein assembly factor BamD n=1 Tax=Candidatus Bandiella euplotis TaxID=1664265 RepID=A0ABZ0UNJ5_9RICK|nr:outer membrane protein assembly factor BamD [Candidatus Bandiella woodruffii]WPX97097.1 Outer membrane protein assembly factor BamD precursor [Candidatus Bandiella woodruffii]